MAKVNVQSGMKSLLAAKARRQDALILAVKLGRHDSSKHSNLWISPENLKRARPLFKG